MLKALLTRLLHLTEVLIVPVAMFAAFTAGNYAVHALDNSIAERQAEILDARLLAYARSHPDKALAEGVNYPPSVTNIRDITGEGMPTPVTIPEKIMSYWAPDILFSHRPNEEFYSFQYIPLKADGSEWTAGTETPPNYYNLEYFTISPMGGNVYRHVSKGSYESLTADAK